MSAEDTRRAILSALADGASGPDLAERLDVSRAAVWNHVEALRDAGFAIESGPSGYRISGVPEYGGLAVEYGLGAPYTVEYHDRIESTNDRARELAREGRENIVVLADEQTGGRGRLERAWASPPGGIWMSVVLRPSLPPAQVPLLTLGAAVAVTAAARQANVEAWIKWPNDIIVGTDGAGRGGRKLGGVLTELDAESGRVNWIVIGMGVNADVPDDLLPPEATSLRALGGDVDRRAFVQTTLETLHNLVTEPDRIIDRWLEYERTLGRRVRITMPGDIVEGTAQTIAENGGLVVDTDNGRQTVYAGDCEHLRF